MNNPIFIPQDTWLKSPLSIARHYGGIRIEGQEFYIEGTDLVHNDFIPFLRKLGRKRFLAILRDNPQLPNPDLKRIMQAVIKAKVSVPNKAIPSPTQPSLFD